MLLPATATTTGGTSAIVVLGLNGANACGYAGENPYYNGGLSGGVIPPAKW